MSVPVVKGSRKSRKLCLGNGNQQRRKILSYYFPNFRKPKIPPKFAKYRGTHFSYVKYSGFYRAQYVFRLGVTLVQVVTTVVDVITRLLHVASGEERCLYCCLWTLSLSMAVSMDGKCSSWWGSDVSCCCARCPLSVRHILLWGIVGFTEKMTVFGDEATGVVVDNGAGPTLSFDSAGDGPGYGRNVGIG